MNKRFNPLEHPIPVSFRVKLYPSPMKAFIISILLLLSVYSSHSQNKPQFDNSPAPKNSKWQLVKNLSDEFSGGKLDQSKWINADPNGWIGRPPGIFLSNTVSLENGYLMITNYQLDEKIHKKDQEFTHAGGHLESLEPAHPCMYFECRMKSNKTFMSSTFWLINHPEKHEGCDKRVTELDIQESVGTITTDEQWAQKFNRTMNSNTHSRHVTCDEKVGKKGNKKILENEFYNIKLVTETYDWNPVPSDGGMTGSKEDRTTYYDWVRTWKLN